MLDPNDRSLLIDAVRPPPGHRFVAGVALTYSLDLTTLLTIPLQLAVLGSGRREELLKDPVALLEALRRTSSKLVVVCQHARIAAPGQNNILYGLLERSVVEVSAPNGGVFHPKLWALQYEDAETGQVLVRLIVLSRNLTSDRSWDLSMTLEGKPGGRVVAANRPIAALLASVPGLAKLAARQPSVEAAEVLASISDLVASAKWDEMPGGFDEVSFQVLGLDRKPWIPEPSERLAVISPFIGEGALRMLIDSTRRADALISRPEELAKIDGEVLKRFRRVLVLHEQAETEDGEDTGAATPTIGQLAGLHAKAYLTQRSWYTTLYLGSANATGASMLAGNNVELVVGLAGRTSKVGGVNEMLCPDGLLAYLTDFAPPPQPPEPSVEEQAEDQLNEARATIATAGLGITFDQSSEDTCVYAIQAQRPPVLVGVASFRCWPVSLAADRAVDATPLSLPQGVLRIGPLATASLTSFVAFELMSDRCDLTICFVLNLPVVHMPEHRDAAVLRQIVANREGFLRYLLLLLSDDSRSPTFADLATALGGNGANWRRLAFDELPLLEELTRAFSRHPERLGAIRSVVEKLMEAPNGHKVVPPEFLEVWQIYEAAMGGTSKKVPTISASAPTQGEADP